MTLLVDDYQSWLASRKYKEGTIYNYLWPIKIAAERGLSFEQISDMDAHDFYCLIVGHSAPRHSQRALYQSVLTYREFLWRTGRGV